MRLELTQPASLGLLGRAPGLIPEWRVGAVIEATAMRDAASRQLWLNIGQMRFTARLASGDPAGPADGELLRLKVLRNSPILAFETLDTDAAEAPDVTGDALRRVLPRQGSPAPLLANLAWLAADKERADALPRDVTGNAARIWQAIATASEFLDADDLAAILRRSGIFLESHLLATQSSPRLQANLTADLKAALLSLKEALALHGGFQQGMRTKPHEALTPLPMLKGPLPPLSGSVASLPQTGTVTAMLGTLAEQTDGALARLTATQLINAAAGGLAWLIEVPVRHEREARMLRFRFESDTRDPEDRSAGWTVEATFELRDGEAVHARVSLRQQRVSVQLRSDSPALVSRFKGKIAELSTALLAAGLNVDQVVCAHGLPVDDPGRSRSRLVDVRA